MFRLLSQVSDAKSGNVNSVYKNGIFYFAEDLGGSWLHASDPSGLWIEACNVSLFTRGKRNPLALLTAVVV